MKQKRPTVFISYASADADFADLVKMKLNEANIKAWMDQEQLNAGEEWRSEIDLGIIDSDVIIVILTPESCISPYVTYEWAFAIGRTKKVIPVLYKKAQIHPRIDGLQYLDFTVQKNKPWGQLLTRVSKLMKENSQDTKSSNLVSGMTVEELKQLLSGTMSLANATAKNEGRSLNQGDISEAITNIAHANINLEQSELKSTTILWVDDIPDNNIYEREAFLGLGFRFDLALSTNEALQKLNTNKYSAIISDMGRVEGPREGYVLLEKIRATDKTVPYFIYAGSNSLEHKREAAQRGAQGTTNRPKELIELVTKYVSIK